MSYRDWLSASHGKPHSFFIIIYCIFAFSNILRTSQFGFAVPLALDCLYMRVACPVPPKLRDEVSWLNGT